MTGGSVISEDLGIKLENVTVDMLGRANRVSIEKDNTTIVDGAGKKSDIQARVKQINTPVEETKSDYDREKPKERLAKLSGGVAVIRVGAPAEPEMKAKKEALDDAISATKAAVSEGIVPGGGLALLRCVEAVSQLEACTEGHERTGVQILKRALKVPSSTDCGELGHRWRRGCRPNIERQR